MFAHLTTLTTQLDYTFNDSALLTQALTHRSWGGNNNERLEFLGDGLLNFIVGQALFIQYPQASEGELSRLRASFVREETLADIARTLGLGQYLNLGMGEAKSGGIDRTSILADALEAIVAAIFLDGGFEAARHTILHLYEPKMMHAADVFKKDAKSRLQEWLQSRHKKQLPAYTIVHIEGAAHSQLFTISCCVEQKVTQAQGSSRKRAEQDAAQAMLELLGLS